jgi:flavin reductase (DIM6/NTAB) family NADH-FMN oxidoreductase RutF
MHQIIDPGVLYFATPVVLISSLNEDDSPNLAPMSSAWWLGRRCLLGLGARSKTPQNIIRGMRAESTFAEPRCHGGPARAHDRFQSHARA